MRYFRRGLAALVVAVVVGLLWVGDADAIVITFTQMPTDQVQVATSPPCPACGTPGYQTASALVPGFIEAPLSVSSQLIALTNPGGTLTHVVHLTQFAMGTTWQLSAHFYTGAYLDLFGDILGAPDTLQLVWNPLFALRAFEGPQLRVVVQMPELGSLPLLGIGLVAVAFLRRRQQAI